MQVGDEVEGSLLGGAVIQRGTIAAINGGRVDVHFPPGQPFGVLKTRLIPNGPNKWKVYFNSGVDIPDRRGDF